MKEITLDDFVKNCTNERDLCHYYKNYSKDVQIMLSNIFNACWRFNLRTAQTNYILNEALKPFIREEGILEIL